MTQSVPPDNSWYDSVRHDGQDLSAFILAAYEKRMQSVWPQPKSTFYCRPCNYSEFTSQDLLNRHLQSARHLVSFIIVEYNIKGDCSILTVLLRINALPRENASLE